MEQIKFNGKVNKVVFNQYQSCREPQESKGDPWKARLEPRDAARYQALIDAKQISRSEFIRDCLELGEIYHGYKNLLLGEPEFFTTLCRDPELISIIKSIAKKF